VSNTDLISTHTVHYVTTLINATIHPRDNTKRARQCAGWYFSLIWKYMYGQWLLLWWNLILLPNLRRFRLLACCDKVQVTQNRQCRHNVTLRRLRVKIAVENQYYIIVLCERECMRVALLIQYATRLRHIVPPLAPLHYLINGTIFGKMLLTQKMRVRIFSTFVWSISHSKKNLARYCQKCENFIM
jgi:hypothetical protein